jgi:membrane-bound serine protease (ClpP class)
MTPASKIGDCGVLMASPMGVEAVPEELRAKAESPVLAQFRDSANRHGYSTALCEALVVKERVVWWMENTSTGQAEFVGDDRKVLRIGEGLDPTTRPAADGPSDWKLVESYHDQVSGKRIAVHQPIVDQNELLTMSQSEAIAYGFCKGIAGTESALKARFNLEADLPRLEFTWSELLVGWMTSMPVRIFLLIIILLGAYVEFHTPGVGVAGLVALIALGAFVGAPYLTGLANVTELALILLGVLLLIVELFVLPGFGFAGVAGLLLVLLGVFLSFVPSEPGPWRILPQLPATWEAMKSGATAMTIALVISVALMWYLAKHLPQMPLVSQLILSGEVARGQTIDAGTTAIETVDLTVGDCGVALSILRPAGKARIRDQVRDVVTEGDMVQKGAPLEVIDVSGNHVVVRRLDQGGDGEV